MTDAAYIDSNPATPEVICLPWAAAAFRGQKRVSFLAMLIGSINSITQSLNSISFDRALSKNHALGYSIEQLICDSWLSSLARSVCVNAFRSSSLSFFVHRIPVSPVAMCARFLDGVKWQSRVTRRL